jgi:predicted negative regulator of RcsB-dependent stress response
MATARSHKRITRKELRQPDWFQVTTERSLTIYAHHRGKVIAGAIAFIIVLLLLWGWDLFKDRQNTAASEEFGRAAALYRADKHREAIEAFQKVAAYRWSHYARFAHLYQANSYVALGELDKALPAAQRFLAGTGENTLYRQIALVTLALIEERKGQTNQALQHYSQAEGIKAAYREKALLGKARTSEQAGDLKAALAAYREYVREDTGSPFAVKVAEWRPSWPDPAPRTERFARSRFAACRARRSLSHHDNRATAPPPFS